MNRLVYLYELDSAVGSEAGIKVGKNALLEETLGRGNQVVISFNQLTDSKALIELLHDEKTYEQVLRLFKNGSLKVVRFSYKQKDEEGNVENVCVRTAAQYLLNNLESLRKEKTEEDAFICGGIPMKKGDTKSVDRLCRAIMYNDPHLVKTDKKVFRYVNVILEISKNPDCYIEGKEEKWEFIDLMHKICDPENMKKHLKRLDGEEKETYKRAVTLLTELEKKEKNGERLIRKPNARSGWVSGIREMAEYDEKGKNLALHMVHLCYNYAVEDGIEGVTKRYTVEHREDEKRELPGDYIARIREYFKNPEKITATWGKEETPQTGKALTAWGKAKAWVSKKIEITKLMTAVHVLDVTKWIRKKGKKDKEVYKAGYSKELFCWQLGRGFFIVLSMCMAFVYGFIFYFTDMFSDWWKSILKTGVENMVSVFDETAMNAIVTTVSFAIVIALIKLVKKVLFSKTEIEFELPDFAESFFLLLKGIRDIVVIFLCFVGKLVRKVIGKLFYAR